MIGKNFWESKIVQVMVIQFAISFVYALQEFLAKQDYSPVAICGMIISTLVIVLRVFFTTEPINQGMTQNKADELAKRINSALSETDNSVE